jgi:hypothetical protein
MRVPKPASKPGPASVPSEHEEDPASDCGPMTQQDMQSAHGRDMHPQKLVRLVGCHDVSVRKPEDEER